MLNMKLITKENHEKLKSVYERIMSIYNFGCRHDDDHAWEEAYHAIFASGLCRIVHECVPSFEWCDPDASYQDDVCAFVSALNEIMNNIEVI